MKYIILLLFIQLHFVSLCQRQFNELDIDGKKNGLWMQTDHRNNILKLEMFSRGICDGFVFHFSQEGEILFAQFYDYGKIKELKNFFPDTLRMDYTDKSLIGFTGIRSQSADWKDKTNRIVLKNGYLHGVAINYINKSKKKEIVIFYKGQLIYVINCNRKLIPKTYNCFFTLPRGYMITSCIATKNTLKLKYANRDSFLVQVPSLLSRTMSYQFTKGKLFHELYKIHGDTLIVNLNHKHEQGRFYPEGYFKNRKAVMRKRVNYRAQRFAERLLGAKETASESVKIYTHGIYIDWIILNIDGQKCTFKNNEYLQTPLYIPPGLY